MAKITEKPAKSETHTAGTEIWRETVEYMKYCEIHTVVPGF
jgi:hypothetical protein